MIDRPKLIKILKALFKQDGKEIYPYQLRIIESPAQFKIINKSRQVGISYLLAAWGLIRAIFNDEVVLIVSPSERQSKHLMKYAYDLLRILENDFNIRKEEETKTSLIFAGGGAFYSLPANPRTIRGFSADLIDFDEFAHFQHGDDKAIWEAALPSISRGGEVYISSTPFGKYNLFYELWHNEDFKADRFVINYKDCPHLDVEEIRNSVDERTFAQEYDNTFIEDEESQEFTEKLIRSCIDNEITPGIPDNAILLAGVDIGRKEDLTAVAIIEKVQDGSEWKYILRDWHTWRNLSFQEQEQRLRHLIANNSFENVNIDATGLGMMLAENLAREFNHVRQITFTADAKEKMVLNLKKLMQTGKFVMPDDAFIISSFRAIKRKYTEGNILKFESERNAEIGHADLFWAIALALYNVRGKSVLPAVVKLERW